MDVRINLSHQGLARLGSSFDFVLKTDSEDVLCNKSQILFLSPAIEKILKSDPTISEYHLLAVNSGKCAKYFQDIFSGNPIMIKSEDLGIFNTIVNELGNKELFTPEFDHIDNENVFASLSIKISLGLDLNEEIKFIAEHFCEFKKEYLETLDLLVLEEVFSSPKLIIESEIDLFSFIRDLYELRGNEYKRLFGFINIEYLTQKELQYFLNIVDLDNVGPFWSCICSRLLCPLASFGQRNSRARKLYRNILYLDNNNFNGIFSHLWRESGGNPANNETISILATKPLSNTGASSIIDPEKRYLSSGWFCGNDDSKSGAYVVDFKNKEVSLTSYSLKAHNESFATKDFVNSWDIEGSNDGVKWELISHEMSSKLQSHLAEGHWDCPQSKVLRYFRYFRIKLSGANSSGRHYFAFNAIEFFGYIRQI